jgi:hypothetical protein
MVLKLLSPLFSSVLVLPVRPSAPALALGAVLVLARRLSVFGVATVNRKFQRNSKALGFGLFPVTGHFPFATSGLGCRQFVYAAAFPANRSNTTLNTGRHETAVVSSTFGAWRRLATR